MAHAERLERFERDNRAFFAAHIADRGDDYFDNFPDRLAALVAENDTGTSLCCVLVDAGSVDAGNVDAGNVDAGNTVDGSAEIVGRVNVLDIDQPGRPEIGFRIAERQQGRGVATIGVTLALAAAAARGVRVVHARAAKDNVGSQRVLQRCGFVLTGPTEAPPGATRAFLGFRKDLP